MTDRVTPIDPDGMRVYNAVHAWVRRHLPKPAFCQDCGIAPPRDLANISQKYYRDLGDWKWVCRRCHMTEDGRLERQRLRGIENRLPDALCIRCGEPFRRPYSTKDQLYCSRNCLWADGGSRSAKVQGLLLERWRLLGWENRPKIMDRIRRMVT